MDHVRSVYKTRVGAEDALRRLETIGIADSQISILSSDEPRCKAFGIEKGTKIDEGIAAGLTVGRLVGALSAGVIAIPGHNLVVSGYLISARVGLGAGAAKGGLIGGLVGAGFKENEAKFCENEIKEGNILLAIKTRVAEQKKQVKEILDEIPSNSMNMFK